MKLKVKLPPSFPALLLTGFVLVALPLLGGIVGMSDSLHQMAWEGRRSVNLTAEITHGSRQLAEQGTSLKRVAGQYFVLEDPALKQRLERAHELLLATLLQLRQLPWQPEQARLVEQWGAQEAALFERLMQAPTTGAQQFERFSGDFLQLEQMASAVADQAAEVVQRQKAGMSVTAERIQAALQWQVGALIVLSMVLSALLSWLLSRPVFQLAATIRRLGSNDLVTQSSIRGPRDMVFLGEQLDWLRRRLQELEEQKLSFFREVSHELKTPLTNLLEALALLKEEVTGPLSEAQREIVAIMHGSLQDLRRRLEDLLRYNETISQPRVVSTRFDLRELVDEVVARVDLVSRAKQLRWQIELPESQIRADRGRLAVTLENLIGNALKFSPERGTVGIAAQLESGQLRIVVCDQGPGIPPDEVDKLFIPFQRGTRQPAGALKSSGLGLAIARAHVEAQGGRLILQPPPQPQTETQPHTQTGACFEMVLPQQESPHDAD